MTPARCIAIGIYDNKGTLRRTIPIHGNGTTDAFTVAANEMVYSILDLGDGTAPSLAPWQTNHRPALVENRWAAFTDDELESIAEAIERTFGEHEQSPNRPMLDELEAELERRVPGTPPPQ